MALRLTLKPPQLGTAALDWAGLGTPGQNARISFQKLIKGSAKTSANAAQSFPVARGLG